MSYFAIDRVEPKLPFKDRYHCNNYENMIRVEPKFPENYFCNNVT